MVRIIKWLAKLIRPPPLSVCFQRTINARNGLWHFQSKPLARRIPSPNPWLATLTKNKISSEDAVAKLLRWSAFQISLTWTMTPPSPSGREYRDIKVSIFFDPQRRYLDIAASNKLSRSFLLSACERIAALDDAVELTLLDGTRHLLVEPRAE